MIVIDGKEVVSKISSTVIGNYTHKIGVPAYNIMDFLRRQMTYVDVLNLFYNGIKKPPFSYEKMLEEIDSHDGLFDTIYGYVLDQLFPNWRTPENQVSLPGENQESQEIENP